MRLCVLEDRIELEGTQKVILQAEEWTADCDKPKCVLLKSPACICGAVVAKADNGSPSVAMDKFLRIFLRVRSGDFVDVEPRTFPLASRVELVVPPEYEREGLVRLIRDSLVGRPLSNGQTVPLFVASLTGEQTVGEVAALEPEGTCLVGRDTQLTLRRGKIGPGTGVTYKDIGALGREIERIRELIEYPIRNPEAFRRLGIAPPRGILLYGPPGTGKTLIAKALAHELGVAVHTIQGPEIMSAWVGGSEENIRRVFEEAKAQAPAIILIDEIDSIAPHRQQTRGAVEHRVVATLLTFMDGLSELKDVFVIGTTNAINTIDPALRRPGRFEHEIHIGVPDARGRREILQIQTRRMPLADDIDLADLAEKCIGFVGADLAALCREAAYAALRRVCGQNPLGCGDTQAVSNIRISAGDFAGAAANIRPSAMREIMVEVPRDVGWDSIGGLEEIRQLIVENVIYGMRRRADFQAVGIKPARGLLLYGPPGTGKTLLAKVVARESGANFIAVRGPEVYSKWFGDSEARIRFIFGKAREVAPCVIFFDEIDALAPVRGGSASSLTDPIVNQLLAEMDGIEKNDDIFVIGATNRVELLDPAMLRPGRFDYQIVVDLPDEKSRRSIFAVHLKNKPVVADIPLDQLAHAAEDFSGADIAEACRLATLAALREVGFESGKVQVTILHLEQAVGELARKKSQLSRAFGFHGYKEQ